MKIVDGKVQIKTQSESNEETNDVNKEVEQGIVKEHCGMIGKETDNTTLQEMDDDTDDDQTGPPVDRGWAWVILTGKTVSCF
jgi:hypothetical protein